MVKSALSTCLILALAFSMVIAEDEPINNFENYLQKLSYSCVRDIDTIIRYSDFEIVKNEDAKEAFGRNRTSRVMYFYKPDSDEAKCLKTVQKILSTGELLCFTEKDTLKKFIIEENEFRFKGKVEVDEDVKIVDTNTESVIL